MLLAKRGGVPRQGYWSIPGGIVETGEYLEDAVRREMLEETGCQVEPLALITIFERIMHDEHAQTEYHFVVADFLCRLVSGTPRPGDDCAEVAWFHSADLGTLKLTEGAAAVIAQADSLRTHGAYKLGTTRI